MTTNCRKLLDTGSNFPVISGINISHYNFVHHKNVVSSWCVVESLLLVIDSNIMFCGFV